MRNAEYYKGAIKCFQEIIQHTRNAEYRMDLVNAIEYAQEKLRILAQKNVIKLFGKEFRL